MCEMVDARVSRLNDDVDALFEVLASVPLLGDLGVVLTDVQNANQRGYFLPDEDERLMRRYVGYLSQREVLLEIVASSKNDFSNEEVNWEERLSSFAVGFAAALVLVRAGKFIIQIAEQGEVVRKKLDDAESRYGLARKSFAYLYKNLTDPQNAWAFYEAVRFYEVHQADFEEMAAQCETMKKVSQLMQEEYGLLDYKKRDAVVSRFKYRYFSFKRRSKSGYIKAMFHLFRLSGSQIAEMKQPHIAKQSKNVDVEILDQAQSFLKPGDILITRHEDALSNLFLPGFWPHAALYIGNDREREELSISLPLDNVNVIEAKKDGVKLRQLSETLEVDAFIVIRPSLTPDEIRKALLNAIGHAGKRYDFLFDFASSNRLACTEVVYRGFHGVGNVHFDLVEKAGRMCLPAEDLINQTLDSGRFHLIGCFTSKPHGFMTGASAYQAFLAHKASLVGEVG